MLGQKFGRRVAALQFRYFIQVAIVERSQHGLQRLMGAADVDDDAIGVERLGTEGRVDHKRRAMKRLRRPEHGATK